MDGQAHDWRIVRENLHADGLLQVQRCLRCNADRTIWTPLDGPPQVLTTHPAQLPPDCPQAPRQRRPQATTTAERSGATQEQAPFRSGSALRAKHDRQQNRLFLLFAVGIIIAVMLVLTSAANKARRVATLKTIETSLFYIDDAVTVEAAARATRYDAALTARAAFTTREAAFATGEAPAATSEAASATSEAAHTTFERAAAVYAADMDSAPAAATYEAALATLETARATSWAALDIHAAALFENEIPAATIEAAAFATLETASQDHEEAAALATAAVTYEAQTLATIEAQEALPWWYWLLPQR